MGTPPQPQQQPLMPTPEPGFAPAPVGSTQWNAQVVQANAEAMQQNMQQRKAQTGGGPWDMVPDFIKEPIEWTGSALHSVYSNVISRPLSTVFLATYMGSAESNDAWGSWGKLFDGDVWDRAYKDAKNVSPGQALEFGAEHLFDTHDEFRQAMQKPVNYTPKDELGNTVVNKQGQPITFNLNQAGLIWDNPDAVKVHFDEGVQKWVSGGLDAAISWYADPMVLSGKGLGMLRQSVYIRPALDTDIPSLREKLLQGAYTKLTGQQLSGPVNNVEKNLNSSAFTSMGDLIMKYKANPDTFSDWAGNQAWARNASDSQALIAALSKAADRDQVNNVLGIAMGDRSLVQQLRDKNAELGAQMENLQMQKDGAISNYPAILNPTEAQQYSAQMSLYADQMSQISKQSYGIQQVLGLQDAMKNGMYYNPILSPMASNFGQYARSLSTVDSAGASWLTKPAVAALGLAYNNLYVRPLRVITGTTWDGVRAPGHIDLNADNSYRGVDAALDQAKVWSPEERAQMVSSFIDAEPQARNLVLQAADRATVGRIAAKYGLTDAQANQIYATIGGFRAQAQNGRIYSTALIDDGAGGTLRADHVADDGGLIAVSPILNTQLQNTYIMNDYEHMNKVLGTTASAFRKLFNEAEISSRAAAGIGPLTESEAAGVARQASMSAAEQLPSSLGAKWLGVQGTSKDIVDVMNKIWKFNVLFRMGYGPRAISDDFLGQAARLGAYNFFVDRIAQGGMGQFMRTWNRTFGDPTGFAQQQASIQSGIDHLTEVLSNSQKEMDRINGLISGGGSRSDMAGWATDLQVEQRRYNGNQGMLNGLKDQYNKLLGAKARLGDSYTIMPDGTAFARPFEGPQGALFKDLNSGRRTIDAVLGGTANDIWNKMRSGDWSVTSIGDGDRFYRAWLKDVQFQIANDPAAMAAVRGGKDAVLDFFRSPEGRAYRRESAIGSMGMDEHADRIAAHIDHYLPTGSDKAANLRDAVMNGADDATVMKLMRDVEPGQVPTSVQTEGLKYAMGKGDTFKAIDNFISGFYKKMSEWPSEVLSRNPLFFQLYRQHVSDMWQISKDQGIESLSARDMQAIEEQARKAALKDVKRFTFNIDFESKLTYNMRFIAPFFGPMKEAFSRWGRIAADRPEIISKAANVFTSPIRTGHAVDKDGQPVDADGYAINKDTGERYLVPKGDMHIQYQMPTWASKAIGQDGGMLIDMPINTLNIALQNDPWFNPGMGPWVQLPANWAALRSDPAVGDWMQKLGILNRVDPDSKSVLTGGMSKQIAGLFGNDQEQQQRDMIQIMQREDYKWRMGMRPDEPTWAEVKDKAETGAYLRAFLKSTLPISTSFKDPYQFFRDRYNELQKADFKTADQVFLDKYGDAAFAFTGALTSSKSGAASTREAVLASQKYADILAKDPDAAKMLLAPYSSGDFSQTAYAQQLSSGERTKLSPQEVMSRARTNAGFAQYGKIMNQLTAELYQQGFGTFQDKGAEDLDNTRKILNYLLTTSHLPDGTVNKFYNEDFANAFLTQDKNKEQRMADAMNMLVTDKDLMSDQTRQDIQGLAKYMVWRNSATEILNNRKIQGGSGDIKATSNDDIRYTLFNEFNRLVRDNTAFQSLHDRFLSRDMFDHYTGEFRNVQ